MNFYINKVTIAGNLGKDPETRSFGSGNVVNLTVAVGRSFKKDGAWVNETEWFNVVIWNEHIQKITDKLSKGSSVYIEGESRTRKWKDSSGNDKYSTEVFLGKYDGVLKIIEQRDDNSDRSDSERSTSRSTTSRATTKSESRYEDDEIPF